MKDAWKRFRTMVAVRSQGSLTTVPSPPEKRSGAFSFWITRSFSSLQISSFDVLHVSWFSLRVYRDRVLVLVQVSRVSVSFPTLRTAPSLYSPLFGEQDILGHQSDCL